MYSRPGHSHVVCSRKAELNWKASYFSLPSCITHVIPGSRNAGWGCGTGNQRDIPWSCPMPCPQAGATSWWISWDLWGACVIQLRTVLPGDKTGTHLCVSSCAPLLKGRPWELTPWPNSGLCMCESPKGSAILHAMVSEKSEGKGKMYLALAGSPHHFAFDKAALCIGQARAVTWVG